MSAPLSFTRRDTDVNPGERDAIDRLSDRAAEAIRRVIGQRFPPGRFGYLRDDEREDLCSTAMLRVLERLRSERDPGGAEIENFDGYVAAVTLHTCDDLIRERRPRRTAAKNRVVYVLLNDSRYAQWTIDGETVCGLASWRDRRTYAQTFSVDAVRHLAGDRDVRRMLGAVFLAAQQPVELNAVVNAAAELWDMVDRPAVVLDEAHAVTHVTTTHIDDRQFLERLWQEIRLLNRPQRAALLLNLRDDSGSATELFSLLGVATVAEIAEAVGLPQEALAVLWPSLPIDDLQIAAMLNLSRQQVINLRRSARERLRRRMRY